jgi:hypothetical protein
MKKLLTLLTLTGIALTGCGDGIFLDNNAGYQQNFAPILIPLTSIAKQTWPVAGWQTISPGGSIPGFNLDYSPGGNVGPFQNPTNNNLGQVLTPIAAANFAAMHLLFDVSRVDLKQFNRMEFKAIAQGGRSPYAAGVCTLNSPPTSGANGFMSGLWNASGNNYVTLTSNNNSFAVTNLSLTIGPPMASPSSAAITFGDGTKAIWITLASQDASITSTGPCSDVTLLWAQLTLLPF